MGKYLAVTVPFLGITLFFVQSYYLRTSRQVRILDIEAKSPLFTHFTETMQGISVIRALHWESTFEENLQNALNQSQKPFYMLLCIQQWLELVLDCIVAALAVILVATATSLKSDFSAGAMGVALNLVLTFNMSLTQLIKSWTSLETSIGAVARVQEFVAKTPSEERVVGQVQVQEGSLLLLDWPAKGGVEFRDVVASYGGPDASPVLNHLSLSFKPREKIAVCGPSGSGKTSLVLALLQMVDVQKGTITIDGVNLASVQCGDLRSRINVIPQDPFFMPGSIRFNLDPRQDADSDDDPHVSDAYIEAALQKVGLWKKVSAGGGLDMTLTMSDWSVGERQLLALARALMVKSSILILDEATSRYVLTPDTTSMLL